MKKFLSLILALMMVCVFSLGDAGPVFDKNIIRWDILV